MVPIACLPSLWATATWSIPIFSLSLLFANRNCSYVQSEGGSYFSLQEHDKTECTNSTQEVSATFCTFKGKKELEREAIRSSS
jgi:hypothetical protein